MKLDILIKNGRVIDPSRNLDAVEDIGVIDNLIVAIPGGDVEAGQIIDASGCLVLPRLIDYHARFLYSGTTPPIRPDLMSPPESLRRWMPVPAAAAITMPSNAER
ncbi:hypothetical protein AGMMS50256_14470 [Betaproteobacteria bacterium]|nr:hypothetical protein AGMMS50256_14470 [Betaproteobacteria bacterium]